MPYFTTWCPKGTSIETLVRVEGNRWRIEEGFETAKNELGLDHNETRSWHGWHRHVSLVMLAYAMMAGVRHQANSTPKKRDLDTKELIRWSVQEIRRLAFKLAQRQIKPAHILAWSVFRRAHQAALTSQIQNATVVLL
jgi:Transposase DDE domain